MSKFIQIENKGQEILSTNYYETELNYGAKYFVSLNDGAFRLLIPEVFTDQMRQEFSITEDIVITKTSFQASGGLHEGYELLLDDKSGNPYRLYLTPNSFDRLPSQTDINKKFVFSAWVRLTNKKIEKIFESKCFYTSSST